MDNPGEQKDDTTSSDSPKDNSATDSTDATTDDGSDTSNIDDGTDGTDNEGVSEDNNSNIDSNLDQGDMTNIVKNQNYIQDRRILLSQKLLKLYDSISESVNDLINSPAFQNKPVKLKQLEDLLTIVKTVNESINKEPDHKVILLKYALCVKTYSRIMKSI
jgi:hypothetical protein